MKKRILSNLSPNRNQLNTPEDQRRSHRRNSSLFGLGCLFCVLLGVSLLGVFNWSGETISALKTLGLSLIFFPALMFGVGANFLDKPDEKRQRAQV